MCPTCYQVTTNHVGHDTMDVQAMDDLKWAIKHRPHRIVDFLNKEKKTLMKPLPPKTAWDKKLHCTALECKKNTSKVVCFTCKVGTLLIGWCLLCLVLFPYGMCVMCLAHMLDTYCIHSL